MGPWAAVAASFAAAARVAAVVAEVPTEGKLAWVPSDSQAVVRKPLLGLVLLVVLQFSCVGKIECNALGCRRCDICTYPVEPSLLLREVEGERSGLRQSG